MGIIHKIGRVLKTAMPKLHISSRRSLYSFGIVEAMALVSLLWTVADACIIQSTTINAAEAYAQAVEKAPDLWLSKANKNKENMSDFEYRLEIQRIGILRSKTQELANRIRYLGEEAFSEQWEGLAEGQLEQVLIGEAGGRLVGKAGAKLAGRYVGEGAQKATELLNDYYFTNAGIANRMSEDRPPPKFIKAYEELYKAIVEAAGTDPEKLMMANFHNLIVGLRNWINDCHPTDEQYREELARRAAEFRNLTRAGGSEDSIWADENELMVWLAGQIGRDIKPKDEEDPIPDIPIDPEDYFTEQDFDTLRSSTTLMREDKSISQPPSDDFGPGAIADLSYGGWSNIGEEIPALVGIIAYEKAEQAEYIFNGMREQLIADVLAYNKDLGQNEKSVAVYATPGVITMSRPAWKFAGDYFPDHGTCLRYRLHSNAFIMLKVTYTTPGAEQQAVKILEELESGAMDVVDDALERARKQQKTPVS